MSPGVASSSAEGGPQIPPPTWQGADLHTFRTYRSLGWCVVPCLGPADGGKRPGLGDSQAWRRLWRRPDLWHPARPARDNVRDGDGWSYLRLPIEALEDVCDRPRNVGVNLGEPSGWLADVDLDGDEARELAPRFLGGRDGRPWLTWRFGRKSSPASHWLFVSPGAVSEKLCDLQADGRRGGATICELRATPAGAVGRGVGGNQTILPGSVHKTGEVIDWHPADEGTPLDAPRTVDAAELARAVRRLAAGSIVLRHAGRAAALPWLDGRARCPTLPPAVAALVRELLGAPPATRREAPQAIRPGAARRVRGERWQEAVRDAGAAAVARAFGVEVTLERNGRAGIWRCPVCDASARSSSERPVRAPVEATSDGPGWCCYRCGADDDAVTLAALLELRRSKPYSPTDWDRIRAACEARGILEVKA